MSTTMHSMHCEKCERTTTHECEVGADVADARCPRCNTSPRQRRDKAEPAKEPSTQVE